MFITHHIKLINPHPPNIISMLTWIQELDKILNPTENLIQHNDQINKEHI